MCYRPFRWHCLLRRLRAIGICLYNTLNTMIKIPQYNFYKITTYALLLIICGMVGYRVMDLRKVFATVPVSYITWEQAVYPDLYYRVPIDGSSMSYSGDVNGDSLVDVIYFSNAVYLNTANKKNMGFPGYVGDETYSKSLKALDHLPSFFPPANNSVAGIRVVDINSDGLVDILQKFVVNSVMYEGVYINTGAGWEKDSRYFIPLF